MSAELFMPGIDENPDCLVGGAAEDGRRVLVLGRVTKDARYKSIFGMILRHAGPELATILAPGVWLVDVDGLRAHLASRVHPTAPLIDQHFDRLHAEQVEAERVWREVNGLPPAPAP